MGVHVLRSLRQSNSDIRLLWFSVFIRMISFGITNQVLTLYLAELGISEVNIGIFMSLTMIGDSIISYILTWNSTKIGNRFIMLLGGFLMIIASTIFATGTENFNYLLFAAIVGVISPSGNDAGPFKSIEETVLANLTPPNHRPEVYAIHWILGSLGSSLGSISAGFIVDKLSKNYGFSMKKAYRYTFYVILATSIFKFISLLFISYRAEPSYIPDYKLSNNENIENNNDSINKNQDNIMERSSSLTSENDEHRPLLRIQSTVEHTTITGLSSSTQKILFKLLVPFMIDSFGYGFMTNAWIVYYFEKRYLKSAFILGTLFGFAGLMTSISALPSAWFAKKFGPIKSSILTQIPCGLFFILIPILGYNFQSASILYLLNQLTTAFDVVPRQIILTSLIEPMELPKVMGTVNIGKQIARSISPFSTGFFAEAGCLWVCFVIAGSLLILANVILAIDFSDLDEKVKKLESIDHDI